MFSRHNGISHPPFSSLNISYGVGDVRENVATNRQRIKQALGTPYLLSTKQVHADKIYCASDITTDTEIDGYDALVTNQKGVGLLIQQADCQAILLYDPYKKVIAAIHCGWRGSVANIIGSTIAAMQNTYRTDPTTLLGVVSPSLGPCCAEFINYRLELPTLLHEFQENPHHFNFWDISKKQLLEAGVNPKKIDITRVCTCCSHDYFSYRRTKREGKISTGRNGSAIALPLT